MNKICITGFPKSGTKLFQHMLSHALPDYYSHPQEIAALRCFKKEPFITKMPSDIFKLDMIVEQGFIGFICIRDPFKILTSKHRGDDYFCAWDKIGRRQPGVVEYAKAIQKHVYNSKCFPVNYEELVERPAYIQSLIANKFGFSFENDFADFQDKPIEPGYEYLNIMRPLDTARTEYTEEDKARIEGQLLECPELYEIREGLGYTT